MSRQQQGSSGVTGELKTLRQVAATFQVHEATIRLWTAKGMPVAVQGHDPRVPAPRFKGRSPFGNDDVMTRREVAQALSRHPDSITRALPDGLGAAVLARGGHGKETVFSRALVSRLKFAAECRVPHCQRCKLVFEDMRAVAGHLSASDHGYGRCSDCYAPWALVLPCDGFGGPCQ